MSESADDEIGQREVAYRLFAAEFEDADLSYSEGEDDRSPNYVITPTGARVNRLFAVGVLTEVEQVSDDVLRGRVVDPTGAFVTYAGQYQPDVQAFLERVETPTFVAMTGKARTFQPEDSDQIYTSVRPESINEVDAETRDRWTVQAAEQTLDRIGHIATALTLDGSGDVLEEALLDHGLDEGLAMGISVALEHYGTTPTYLNALRDLALDAARVVAGEKDEVGELRASPDERGSVSAGELAVSNIEVSASTVGSDESTETTGTQDPETEPIETSTEADSSEGTGTSEQAESERSDTQQPESPSSEDDQSESVTESSSTGSGTEDEVSTEHTAATQSTETSGEDTVGSGGGDDLGDFDPDEFELEEETREQVEEEFGTEFQSGTEVGEPGDADIETPDPASTEQADESAGQSDVDTTTAGGGTAGATEQVGTDDEPADEAEEPGDEKGDVTEPAEETTPETEEEPAESDEADEPEDLQAAVVELMGELDAGDGASRDVLVEEMDDRYGVDAGETEEAIQEALMSGECYEPTDGTLKPI